MNSRRIFVGAIASAAILAACGGPSTEDIDASLKAATATALPGSDYDSIHILKSELFPAKWVWQATVDGKAYACDADNRMRLPSCQATS